MLLYFVLAGFVGVVWGGYLRSREARLRFIEENKHEMFKHPYEAQRSMVDRMMLGFGRGGFRRVTHGCTIPAVVVLVF